MTKPKRPRPPKPAFAGLTGPMRTALIDAAIVRRLHLERDVEAGDLLSAIERQGYRNRIARLTAAIEALEIRPAPKRKAKRGAK